MKILSVSYPIASKTKIKITYYKDHTIKSSYPVRKEHAQVYEVS